MPGPVSDAYDPEFGTADNCERVKEAIELVKIAISAAIGDFNLHDILEVIDGPDARFVNSVFSERTLRIIRFALNRALETI
jgi:hypothetical protein